MLHAISCVYVRITSYNEEHKLQIHTHAARVYRGLKHEATGKDAIVFLYPKCDTSIVERLDQTGIVRLAPSPRDEEPHNNT